MAKHVYTIELESLAHIGVAFLDRWVFRFGEKVGWMLYMKAGRGSTLTSLLLEFTPEVYSPVLAGA